MKKLKAFTLVELLITVTVLAVLATIGVGTYSSYLKRTRTLKNETAAKEILQQADVFRTAYRRYPISTIDCLEKTERLCKEGQSFQTLLGEETRKQLNEGVLNPPSINYTSSLVMKFCLRRSDSVSVGATVDYWDLQKEEIVTVRFGNTEGLDITCELGPIE